ncbi:MAG: DUF4389 domain-containing protein [Pseudomonadota bacterium]
MTASAAHDAPDTVPATTPGRTPVWWRGGYMLLFLAAFYVAQIVQALVALVQFLALLAFGRVNPHLAGFGAGLAAWLAQVSRFLTGASERRPWPFAAWPEGKAEAR